MNKPEKTVIKKLGISVVVGFFLGIYINLSLSSFYDSNLTLRIFYSFL